MTADHATGCGLITVLGPAGWKKWLHVWIGTGDACCCGKMKARPK